jgi:hypothetical protein
MVAYTLNLMKGIGVTGLLLFTYCNLNVSGFAQTSSIQMPTDDSAAGKPLADDPVAKSGRLPLYTPKDRPYLLLQKITYGNATVPEVKEALSNTDDVAGLTNTIHALHSMRWHRGVLNLLDDIWLNHRNKYPELAWEQLGKVPVRIAIASTITRIQIFNTEEYKAYIRSHKYDEHEFHRAQVVISLALNADPADVPYLKEMADGDNVYVAQSAITSLGIMGNAQSRDALYELAGKYRGDDRGRLIREIILKAYPPQ